MIAKKYNRSIKTISGQKQTALRKLSLTADHQLFIIKDEILKMKRIKFVTLIFNYTGYYFSNRI